VVSNRGKTLTFDEWISFDLSEDWEFEQDIDDAMLHIYSLTNPKGALQVSFYRTREKRKRIEIANDFVNRFVSQFDVRVDENTRMVIHR
jgi:hypothetical protein